MIDLVAIFYWLSIIFGGIGASVVAYLAVRSEEFRNGFLTGPAVAIIVTFIAVIVLSMSGTDISSIFAMIPLVGPFIGYILTLAFKVVFISYITGAVIAAVTKAWAKGIYPALQYLPWIGKYL